MHLVGLPSSYFANDARSQEPKACKCPEVNNKHLIVASYWSSLFIFCSRCTVKGTPKKGNLLSLPGTEPIQHIAQPPHLFGYKTLRRHLHLLGLLDSPLRRWCAVREETSAHILCECEASASLRHAYMGSFLSWSQRILTFRHHASYIYRTAVPVFPRVLFLYI